MAQPAAAADDGAVKTALLLLRMGLASEAEVFPHGAPAALPPLATKASVAPKAPARQPSWWWPFGRAAKTERKAAPVAPVVKKEAPVAKSAPKPELKPEPKAAEDKGTKVQVRMRWSDAQLATLHPEAVEQRRALLQAEELIHETLEGIERTRQTYLVPADSLPCQKTGEEVAQCYRRVGAAREQPIDPTAPPAPRLGRSTLHCGPVVEAYVKCADAVANKHVANLP